MTRGGATLRRTKLVATLGPASAADSVLRAMIEAGMDVVRVNSSHGTRDERRRWMALVRRLADEIGRHVALLVDLREVEVEMSLDYVATGSPQRGDMIEEGRLLDDASPWSLSLVGVVPLAPLAR